MKALICTQDGFARTFAGDLASSIAPYAELKEIPAPKPRSGQVTVEVEMASVNPSDEMFIRGLYGLPRRSGVPAGFEGVGRVVESGGGLLGRALVGRRVAFYADASGAWADTALTGAGFCIPVGETLRAEDASGFLVNPFTAWALDALVARAGPRSFLMSAAGSQMGKFLIQLASERGRRPIATVRRDEQIEPLKALGAAHVLNERDGDFEDRLRAILRDEKPTVFLDAVAGPRQARIFEAMGEGARWVVYGRLDPEPPTVRHPEQLIFLHKRMEGFWLTDWFADASIVAKARASRAIRRRFESGQWQTAVAEIVPLDHAIERLHEARAQTDGKVFLRP